MTTVIIIIAVIAGIGYFLPLIVKILLFLFSLVYASIYSIIKISFLFFVVYLLISLLS